MCAFFAPSPRQIAITYSVLQCSPSEGRAWACVQGNILLGSYYSCAFQNVIRLFSLLYLNSLSPLETLFERPLISQYRGEGANFQPPFPLLVRQPKQYSVRAAMIFARQPAGPAVRPSKPGSPTSTEGPTLAHTRYTAAEEALHSHCLTAGLPGSGSRLPFCECGRRSLTANASSLSLPPFTKDKVDLPPTCSIADSVCFQSMSVAGPES